MILSSWVLVPLPPRPPSGAVLARWSWRETPGPLRLAGPKWVGPDRIRPPSRWAVCLAARVCLAAWRVRHTHLARVRLVG